MAVLLGFYALFSILQFAFKSFWVWDNRLKKLGIFGLELGMCK